MEITSFSSQIWFLWIDVFGEFVQAIASLSSFLGKFAPFRPLSTFVA